MQAKANPLLQLSKHLPGFFMQRSTPAFESKRHFLVKGFTLVEMAIVISILGVLAAVAFGNWAMTSEVRDAAAVQSAQAVLQQVVAQGATRADISPANLLSSNRANIVNAANLLMQRRNELVFRDTPPNFTVTIRSSGRTAVFAVDTDGNVTLNALPLSQWSNYSIQNGVIQRN